jgi:hypothetical protein
MDGINVFDSTGKLIIDNAKLLHRVWHKGIYSAAGTVYYDEPLNHEPTIVTYGYNTVIPCLVTHVMDGTNYIGFTLAFGNYGAGATMIIVFARR